MRSRMARLPFAVAISVACLLPGCKAENPAPQADGDASPHATHTGALPVPVPAGAMRPAQASSPATAMTWRASGGGPQLAVAGEVDDLGKPFQLTGAIIGGKATFSYRPDDSTKGVVSYQLSGSGVTGSGTGNYTIDAEKPDELVLLQVTRGCIKGVPNSCRTNTDRIRLEKVPKT